MYSWGSGSTGVLAHGDDTFEDAKRPVEATTLQLVCKNAADITQIATSGRHALMILSDQVWAWGDNEYQQCGGNDIAIMCSTPRRLLSVPARVSRVACGWFHSALLTDDGSMFTWGCGQQYQLGHGDSVNHDQPTRVSLDHVDTRLRIAEVSLGWTHSIALSSDGRVLTFGTNQAGLNSVKSFFAVSCNKIVEYSYRSIGRG
jgi:alpha-tubulin suppressor-like RCC1 family protein